MKFPGNLPGAAEDRLADHRRRDHFVVEHDGERLADIGLRRLGEFARAGRIEAEADDRLAGALVKTRLGVGQVGAGDQHALLDQIFCAALAFENLRVLRRTRLRRLLGRHRLIDHAEIELRGLAQNLLQPRRVLQARHLHQDAVDAFALDGRLDQAELVDAPLDDLDRLIDRLADALGERRVARRERNEIAAGRHIDSTLSRRAEDAGQRRRQFAQLGQRVVHIGVARDMHLHAVADDGAAGELNARRAQHAQHVVVERLQTLLAHGAGIDLEQQMRATLQIEAEHDVALRPRRPVLHGAFGEEVRHGEQAHDKCREQYSRRLPPREKQHGLR